MVKKQRQKNRENISVKRWKKKCKFCMEKIKDIDYKNIDKLKFFITEKGKIIGRKITGVCAKHQRKLTVAIKRARFVALLPYVAE